MTTGPTTKLSADLILTGFRPVPDPAAGLTAAGPVLVGAR
jgi:hypothetical protein